MARFPETFSAQADNISFGRTPVHSLFPDAPYDRPGLPIFGAMLASRDEAMVSVSIAERLSAADYTATASSPSLKKASYATLHHLSHGHVN